MDTSSEDEHDYDYSVTGAPLTSPEWPPIIQHVFADEAAGVISCIRGGEDVTVCAEGRGLGALHASAFCRNEECASVLIKFAPELIKARDNRQNTALHWSASSGSYTIVSMLLDEADEFSETTSAEFLGNACGETPLHAAANYGYDECCELLIRRLPQIIHHTDKEGRTAAHYAVIEDNAKTVALILDAGVDIDYKDKALNTALHWSCFFGQTECCEVLLNRHADVFIVNNSACTPLHVAATYGHMHCATKILAHTLLTQGAESTARMCDMQTKRLRTALHYAAATGHAELCMRLVSSGASVLVADTHGQLPVHACCGVVSNGDGDFALCADLLICSNPGTLRMRNADGRTCVELACRSGNACVVDVLMKAVKDLDESEMEATRKALTNIHYWATSSGSCHVVKSALTAFTPTKAQRGRAILLASYNWDVAVLRLLIQEDTENTVTMCKDRNGRNPLHYALSQGDRKILPGHEDDGLIDYYDDGEDDDEEMEHDRQEQLRVKRQTCVIMLREHGCPIDVDKRNVHALHLAAYAGDKDVVDLLWGDETKSVVSVAGWGVSQFAEASRDEECMAKVRELSAAAHVLP